MGEGFEEMRIIKLKTQCFLGLIPLVNFFIVHICICINSKHMKKGWQSSVMAADVIGLIGAILFLKIIPTLVPAITTFTFWQPLVFYICSLIFICPTILVQRVLIPRSDADDNANGDT